MPLPDTELVLLSPEDHGARSRAPDRSANPHSVSLAAVLPGVDDLTNFLAEAEKALILRTLKSINRAQAEAACRLGVSRSYLRYTIATNGISIPGRSRRFGPPHLRIKYPQHILRIRPFKVIDRPRVHGFQVAVYVQRPGND